MNLLLFVAGLALLVIYYGVQPNAILSMSQASVDAMLGGMQQALGAKAASLTGLLK